MERVPSCRPMNTFMAFDTFPAVGKQGINPPVVALHGTNQSAHRYDAQCVIASLAICKSYLEVRTTGSLEHVSSLK